MSTDAPAALPATLAAAVAPVLWATTYWTTTELLPPQRPMISAALRALPAGLLLVAITRELPVREQWLRLAAIGVLNIAAFFALLFYAAYALPGGAAATLSSLSPVFVLGFGALWLSVRPAHDTWRRRRPPWRGSPSSSAEPRHLSWAVLRLRSVPPCAWRLVSC